jgi:AraC-like DNA-binding protein
MDKLVYIALSQVIVLLVLVLSSFQKQKINKNLVYFLIIGFVHLVIKVIIMEFNDDPFVLYNTFNPFSFGYTPALYLFIRELYNKKYVNKWIQLIHFLPLLVFTLIYMGLGFYYLKYGYHPYMRDYSVYGYYILSAQFFIYPLVSIILCIKGIYKTPESSYVFKYCLTISGLLFLLGFLAATDSLKFWPFDYQHAATVAYSALTASFFMVLHMQFNSRISGIVKEAEIESDHHELKSKYQNSGLTDRDIRAILTKIQEYFKHKKVFLDLDYNLEKLASELDIPKHHISQVLNVEMKTNFYGLLNQFRIEEVCKQLEKRQNDRVNILEIAYKCGFNSKTTFNNNFKKIMGYTPTEYINNKNQFLHLNP